jgi:diguanylate cyclase (GGDEF)-like protein
MANPMSAIILDFDTSKLVNTLGDSPRRQAQQDRGRHQMMARLSTVLQTSIELNEILHLFFTEVSRVVPLRGIGFSHAASSIDHTIGDTSGHTVNYRLQTKDDYLGEISFHRGGERYSDNELSLLESLLASLVYPLRNGLRYQEAIRSALTDSLTGVGNRVSMENVMTREFELAVRYEQPLSALMVDLDHFKRINDTYGHAAGDHVIKTVAKTLRAASRNADMTFRYGGEEFVLLLNKTDAPGARITAERMRSTIESLAIIIQGRTIPVTISVGVATLCRMETMHGFIDRADRALYGAKESGRNRVVVAHAEPGTIIGEAVVKELTPKA